MKNISLAIGILWFMFPACQHSTNKTSTKELTEVEFSQVPNWAKEVVWYQIFVERFRNGDVSNDPTKADIKYAYPDSIPTHWKTTPWTQDWYRPDDWFAETRLTQFQDNLQLRRYGGDLQGVLDELDYLSNLGITAIFFNPLNDAPSMHKYDPRYWHHIDRNFGPDPLGDAKMMSEEDPSNSENWQFTKADQLFLKVIDACHQRGIKVIVDYSWNHTGMDFWALNDIRKNGINSKFAGWYEVEAFDNPETPLDEFKYKGWYHIKYLPEIKKAIIGQDSVFPFEGNFASQSAKEHIFNVARRWLDPNKDGNPSDGIDGFRLDVAAEIPLGFWPEFRTEVRKINPEAYLVGEVWWQKFPNDLMDPRPFLKGNKFDAIMNYRWYRSAHQFFAQAEPAIGPKAFADSLQQLLAGINTENNQVMMNLTSSHDSPRTSTSIYNKNKYKFNAKPADDLTYKIDKPDAETRKLQKMLLIHQFTFIGAPHIWYGDEVGMWGADDPDTRKPMVWNDLTYEPESTHPLGLARNTDSVKPDTALFNFIKELIVLRKNNPALVHGLLEFVTTDDDHGLLVYKRSTENSQVWVAFNNSNNEQLFEISGIPEGIYSYFSKSKTAIPLVNGNLKQKIEAKTAQIYIMNK